MKFRSQCPHTKRCWNTATATRPRAVSPGGTEWTQDRARGPQGPEVLAVGPGRGWNCRGPHAGPEGRRTRTALGGQVREERNGGKNQGLEQGRRPAAPPAPGSVTASRRGLGPWPLPNHPGWPAAARTAPRAPRCTPGASFPHVRRCSLTLSCLYSWMKEGWGQNTARERASPGHGEAQTLDIHALASHFALVLFCVVKHVFTYFHTQ